MNGDVCMEYSIKDLAEQVGVSKQAISDMAAQSQALHAGTIQTQLLSENNEPVADQKKKNGIFAKIFGRGKVADE